MKYVLVLVLTSATAKSNYLSVEGNMIVFIMEEISRPISFSYLANVSTQ